MRVPFSAAPAALPPLRVAGAAIVLLLGATLLAVLPNAAASRAGQKPVPSASKQRALAASAVDTYLQRPEGNRIEVRGVVRIQLVEHGSKQRLRANSHSRVQYSLLLEDNRVVELAVTPGNAKVMSALTPGQVVVASGTQYKDEPAVITSIDPQATLPSAGLRPITFDPATHRGPTIRKALVIPVVYSDEAGTSGDHDLAYLENILQGPGKSTKALLQGSSTGVGGVSSSAPSNLAGDATFAFTVRAPVALGGPRPAIAEQCADNPSMQERVVNGKIGLDPLSPDYGNYDHYLYLFECRKGDTPADGDVAGPGSRYYNTSPKGVTHRPDAGVFAHELGHNLRLGHDSLLRCKGSGGIPTPLTSGACLTTEYGGNTDFMGYHWDLQMLNGLHRALLGFIPTQNTRQVSPAENQLTTVHASSTRLSTGTSQLIQVPRPKAAKIDPESPFSYYYLSTRTAQTLFDTFPTGHPLTSGVTITQGAGLEDAAANPRTIQTHPFADLDPESSTDATPGQPTHVSGETRFRDANSLTAGRSFYDPVEDYTISVKSLLASGEASITVEDGPPRGPATSASVVGGRLIIRAGTGSPVARNSVAIVADGDDLVVADHGNVLTPGSGCTAVAGDVQIVRCGASPISAIDVLLGDGDDQASVGKSVVKPATLEGGAGNDTLVAHGAGADLIRGGAGQDFLDPSGPGDDTVSYSDHASSVSFDQNASIWTVASPSGNDEIARQSVSQGSPQQVVEFERFVGGAAADVIRWQQASPTVRTIDGGPGADTLAGGDADETFLARDGAADTSIACGAGNNKVDRDAADPQPANCGTALAVTTITGGPAEGSTVGASASAFTFRNYSATAATETFECILQPNHLTFRPCSQLPAWSAEADGPKTLRVRSVINGVSGTSTVRRFTVDKTEPIVTLVDKPAAGTSTQNTSHYSRFTFASSEGTGQFLCWLDGEESPCQSPLNLASLAEGQHSFSVRASDEAGNVSPWLTSHTWNVVRTLPDTKINAGPDGVSTSSTPTFGFTSQGAASAGFQCRIVPLSEGVKDPPSFAACSAATSHVPSSPLANGRYRFEVRARNAGGGTDPTPETLEFTVIAGPSGTATLSSGTLTIVAAAGHANRIRVRDGASDTLTIEDVHPIRALGCIQVTLRRVTCATRSKNATTGQWTQLINAVVTEGGDEADLLDVQVPSTDGTITTTLRGGDGDDVLRGVGPFADRFEGGAGVDTVSYAHLASQVSVTFDSVANDGPASGPSATRVDLVGADIEAAAGGGGNDTLTAGPTAVTLDGGLGNDTLTGGAATTTFRGSYGSDLLVGGTGADIVDYRAAPINGIDYRGATAKVGKLTPAARNSEPPLTLSTTTEIDTLGASIDKVFGSSSADVFTDGPAAEHLDGGPGADRFAMTPGGGKDRLTGGAEPDGPGTDDVVSYAAYTVPILATAGGTGGPAGSTTDVDQIAADMEGLEGGSSSDLLYGGPATSNYYGGAGADTIKLPASSSKTPMVVGGLGNDTLDLRALSVPVDVNYSSVYFDWFLLKLGQFAPIFGYSTERFLGGSGDDRMRVTSNSNADPAFTFDGGLGADTLLGGRAADALVGGPGNDTITGGLGVDALDGGDGADVIDAKDGLVESVLCGIGTPDSATIDATDSHSGCETVTN